MKKIWLFILRAALITLLAALLSKSIIYDISSASLFAPIEKATDFQLSDFYNTTADMRPVRDLSNSIVIVGIDGMSRHEIADLLNFVNMYFPRVVGLDVLFAYGTADSVLLSAIQQTPNIVLATDAAQVSGTIDPSLVPDASWGAINLAAKDMRDVIRTYQPYIISQSGDTIASFAQALSDLYTGENSTLDISEKYIYFPSQSYEHFDGSLIMDGSYTDEQLADMLEDKLVLISDIHNPFDTHVVPLAYMMTGCELHAHIVNTIISKRPIKETPTTISWILAILIAFLISMIDQGLGRSRYASELSGFMMRVVQIGCIVLFLYIGSYYFVQQRVYINFAPSLLMISLVMLAGDIEPLFELLWRGLRRLLPSPKPVVAAIPTEPSLPEVQSKKTSHSKSKKHKKHKRK